MSEKQIIFIAASDLLKYYFDLSLDNIAKKSKDINPQIDYIQNEIDLRFASIKAQLDNLQNKYTKKFDKIRGKMIL